MDRTQLLAEMNNKQQIIYDTNLAYTIALEQVTSPSDKKKLNQKFLAKKDKVNQDFLDTERAYFNSLNNA
jgi:hypothetical protein